MRDTEKREVMNTKNKMRKMETVHIKHSCGKRGGAFRKIAEGMLSVIAVILSYTLTSCSEDVYEGDSLVDAEHATLTFTVNTRSIESDYDGTGSEDENEINDKVIYFFDNNNKYLATFTATQFSPSDDYSTYTISGKISDEVATELESCYEQDNLDKTGFKVVMLANWGDDQYPATLTKGSTTIDDICTGTFSCDYDEDGIAEISEEGMPFYGVHKYQVEDFPKGELTELEDIDLLRAMAKVEVVDVTKTRTLFYPTIKSAKICRYNPTGYCAPSGIYDQSQYTSDDNGYYVESLHLTGTDNSNDVSNSTDEEADIPTIEMYQTKWFDAESDDEDGDTWVAYIPEYDNSDTNYPCYIELELECNGTYNDKDYDYDDELTENGYKTVKIYFAKDGETSVTPSYYDIHRNKLYRFNVTLPLIYDITVPDGTESSEEWNIKKK